MCISIMAGEGGRGHRSCQTLAFILVLCSLAHSLTGFSLQGLSKNVKQEKGVSEATMTEVRTGSILFNGKALDSHSGPASAIGKEGFLQMTFNQKGGKGILEQLEDDMTNEAVWRHLKPSLLCGQKNMKLKVIAPRASDLQLDMGHARPLPLIQIPETCGYSVKQNALSLVLTVPYDGCNVIQEKGNYVLPMSWLKTPFKLTCPKLTNSATTPAATTPAQKPKKLPLPHGLFSLNRHKRQTNQPLSSYDPWNPYYYLYYYHMYMMTPAPATSTTTTTAKPDTTTITTKPSAEMPPAYPYIYYPHYPYYPYPYYPNYPLPNIPGKTSPPYFPYPFYPPAGPALPSIPNNSEIYYYPIIQHYYGKPPSITAMPGVPTTTVKPSPTEKPTTASATTKPSDNYPGPMSSYVSYNQLPFVPYVSYQYNKAGKIPDFQKFMPQAGYKSGLQARAHPPSHPGFEYWQPVPWFPHQMGKESSV